MELLAFRSLWDWHGAWRGRLADAAAAGYHGIEYTPPDDPADDAAFRRALDDAGLAYLAVVMTAGDDHARSFADQVARAVQLGAVLISAHGATDRMSERDRLAFFESALRVEQAAGVPVAHETHRGRALYTPWHTARVLRALPEVKLGADFSHWSVVCGSALAVADPDISLALDRTIHVHGRVGYAH